MDNKKVFHYTLKLVIIIVVASATSFFATRYYVQRIVSQELKGWNMEGTQSSIDQNGSRDPRDIAKEEADLKSRIQNSNEISGTVVEVGNDYVKIRPSSELLGDSNDQVFIADYLRDRTVKIASDTRILKLEAPNEKEIGAKPSIADIKNGDYVMVMRKEGIGTSAEFTASIIQLSL